MFLQQNWLGQEKLRKPIVQDNSAFLGFLSEHLLAFFSKNFNTLKLTRIIYVYSVGIDVHK
jgi:hypothetical protein